MSIRSAFAGAAATVLVAGGAFALIASSNAAEQPAPQPSATATPAPGTYSTLDVQDPIPLAPQVAPEPAPAPAPTEEPVTVETVAPEPAPVPVQQGTAPAAGSGAVVVQPGTEMPPMPEGVYYVPPPLP